MDIKEVTEIFEQEFSIIKEKFSCHDLLFSDGKCPFHEKYIAPGVYVFWKDYKVWKVGRHLINSRKRALQHITDNTCSKDKTYRMEDFAKDMNAHLLLFNVMKETDRHWVAALEIFLESKLDPAIKSGRLG